MRRVTKGLLAAGMAALALSSVGLASPASAATSYAPGWYSSNPLHGSYGSCGGMVTVKTGMKTQACVYITGKSQAQAVIVLQNASTTSSTASGSSTVSGYTTAGKSATLGSYTCGSKTVPAGKTYYCLGKNADFSAALGVGIPISAYSAGYGYFGSSFKWVQSGTITI